MHLEVGDVLPMICPWGLHEHFGYFRSWNQRWSITMKNPIKLPSKSPEKVTMKSQCHNPCCQSFFRKKIPATRRLFQGARRHQVDGGLRHQKRAGLGIPDAHRGLAAAGTRRLWGVQGVAKEGLPSGKRLRSYRKSPLLMGRKSTING